MDYCKGVKMVLDFTKNEKETEKEDEGEEKKEATTDSGEGDKSESINDIDRANEAAERMARQNDRKEELIKREEKLAVQKALGGSSEAGKKSEEKKEESPADYAKRVMSGDLNDKKD